MSSNTFRLAERLTCFQTAEKNSFPPIVNAQQELNTIIDKLSISPEQLDVDGNDETLESCIDICYSFQHLNLKQQTQLSYLISSSLVNLAQEIQFNLQNNLEEISDLVPYWKIHLQEYGFLSYVVLTFLQIQISKNASANSGAKRSSSDADDYQSVYKNSCTQVEGFLECIIKLFRLNLSRIFQATPEKDQFLSLFLRPVYVILETETFIKNSALKYLTLKMLSLAVKNHQQASSVQNMIISNLTYFMHLNNFNAELLQMLSNEYDYPQLTEEVLKTISNKEFNSKDTTGPKSISNFLIKISELLPRIVLKQMTLVIKLLNNSSFTLRCAVVEACGNIICNISKNDQDSEHYRLQIEVLLELLEERFVDTNPYVRTKAIQGLIKLCALNNSIFNKSRVEWTKLSVRSLQDKSSLVRRNSIKLLSKLVLTHPFKSLHGSQLTLAVWTKRLKAAQKQLNSYLKNPQNYMDGSNNADIVVSNEEGDNTDQEESIIDNDRSDEEQSKVLKMKLTIQYYKEAIEFIQNLHQGIEYGCKLLLSKNKNEVLEAMDFFVLCDAFDIETSNLGIKKMLHLVWMKNSNDEGPNIPSHLVLCYKQLFLTPPEHCNYKEKASYISKNLINLTIGASVTDLVSLEKLLGLLYQEKYIDGNVINVLWAIYNSAKKYNENSLYIANNKYAGDNDENNNVNLFSIEQIHGSIIILGMLALVDSEIPLKGLDYLLNVGLGEVGLHDLCLAKYSCIALQRIVSPTAEFMNVAVPKNLEIMTKLKDTVVAYTEDPEYFPFAEQAINCLFTIFPNPDEIATEIIKIKTYQTFGEIPIEKNSDFSRLASLSQLLFIVGEIVVHTVIYLERCEAEFKKRKIKQENEKKISDTDHVANNKSKTSGINNPGDELKGDKELEMIGGTNEDDFTDAINFIKENELLFGEGSILANFGPLVEELVSDNTGRYGNEMLQRTAVLCLERMMCCSSKYCEKNLPLLITVMEKSPDPIIRSNAVLGLGDMAVCFNNLVDENTDFLYKRLHDENVMVQRTCLMTITFLILAGQVKVKGQLGQMAKCLENSDQSISDMCRLFFMELATKDNAIYNGFIDIFSNLSNDASLSQDSFKKILKFLLSFIDKEKHQKQLSAKLLNRIKRVQTEKEWNDIAYVLSQFPNKTEEVDEVLQQGFKIVSSKE
ncbi:probable Condensin complex subunit 1 [Saccharomycodes ludwigii]|uniref:Condensin complex subunit 1 n=1 Tax=Saccharomycodes ludwigii TaxID=36035 RepID=A0A376BAH6_9ASCO|nr:hypothetical protein SCDLUD_000899 [Saccharomycodes ludwigii]KAH3903274.1 hypothetical protein SCDLUD_000899 [Saccharomycodes ludwigii]SSD61708.1 probable Condensin complex subunit 1 [Saccharomycodes ludwigii]